MCSVINILNDMEFNKLQVSLTSAVCAVGCAGLYLLIRNKFRLREASAALDYLTVKTVYIKASCDEIVLEIRRLCQTHHFVGFDCEWVTEKGKRQPVALVQLSTIEGLCGLFRLCHLKSVPESLKNLLEDKTIYKVGVAPGDDAKYLYQDYSVQMKSTLDIRHVVQLCGHKPGGLAALSKAELGIILDKSWRIRCSDWEADTLTDRQVKYAAADAHVSVKILDKLVNEQNRSFLSFIFKTGSKEPWKDLEKLCQPFVDLHYKDKWSKRKTERINETRQMNKRYPHATRSKPLYHNCFLEAPDGEVLCMCDTKKAQWYVEKELAVIVSDDPLRVRLKFEPAGRSVGDVGRYYQLTKENKCVVCGCADSYIRKNVVPREYRKCFPEIMKNHSSHDVVLLCVSCHQRSNIIDQKFRMHLASLCNAPFSNQGENSKYTEDFEYKKIRSAARALLYQSAKHVLPESRRRELENVLLKHYPHHIEITHELLKEASEVQVAFENIDYESHGGKVVEYFLQTDGGLLRLEEMWREHFLQSMKPKYMPELWSVKHNHERLQLRFMEGRINNDEMKLIGLSCLACY